jgi:hypothetical protein
LYFISFSVKNNITVETTLLKNLPGYVKDLQIEKCETLKSISPKKLREISNIETILQSTELGKNVTLQEINNKNQHLPNKRYEVNKNITMAIEENLNKRTDSEVQTCERWHNGLDKNTMTNRIDEKLKNNKCSEVQTFNICSNDLEVSPSDECIELLSVSIIKH